MAREVTQFATGKIITARSAAVAIAAEGTDYSDANYPTTSAIDCSAFMSIFVGCEITAGSSPTITVEPLFRDADAADGYRWKRLWVGANPGVTLATAANLTTGALTPNVTMQELQVFGWNSVYLRISAVANATSTTAWKILAMPGRRL
jgi:hypothetical protein